MRKTIKLISIIIISLTLLSGTVFAGAVTDKDLSDIKDIMNLIKENYKSEVSNEQLINSAIKGMLSSLDPYSSYYTKDEYNSFIQSINGGYSGIGVSIKKVNQYIQVSGIMKDSPAQKGGLKVGDIFVSVDGISAVNMDIDIFVTKVKGPKGTVVKLGVLRDGNKEPLEYKITRDTIKIENIEYKVLDKNIGYIKIYEFGNDCDEKVKEALKDFEQQKISKVIVDLRGNPGGYLDRAVNICGNFIPKGPIVHVKTNNDKETYYSKLEKQKYKLVVLVDGGSASASEVFAGAVKDAKAGVIIGTKTYGKGTVQTFFSLDDGNYIKLTIANYLTPKETNVDRIGIQPDFVVKNTDLENMNNLGKLNITRNIVIGERGDDVLAIEQRLQALGYNINSPDYIYDNTTQKAVLEYKRDHKLFANKIMTKSFQQKLEKEIINSIGKDNQLQKAIQILNMS